MDVTPRVTGMRHCYGLAALASIAICFPNPPWWVSIVLLAAVVFVVCSAQRHARPFVRTTDPNPPQGPSRPPTFRITRPGDRPFDWDESREAA